MSRGSAPSLALLAAVTALGFCALHMVVPALPLLEVAFAAGPARVQLLLSLYLGAIAIGQLLYGPVSDRFGRRPILLAGLAMFAAGSALCALAGSLDALIGGRVLQACGACAGIVLSRAIVRDIYEREAAARGLALVMMAMSLASAVSPAGGALIAERLGWRAIFALLAGLGAIMLALAAWRLGETNRFPARFDPIGMAGSYLSLLRSRAFAGFTLCSACISAAWFTFIAGAPHLLSTVLGEPPSTYGVMMLLPMAGYILGNAVAVRFALRLGSLRMLLGGRVLACAAGLLMLVWCAIGGLGVWVLFVPIALSSIGDGLSQPAAIAAGLSIQPRIAGAASGLMGCLQMSVAACGSFLVGLVPEAGGFGVIAAVAGLMALALVFAVFAVRQPQEGAAAVPAAAAAAADGS